MTACTCNSFSSSTSAIALTVARTGSAPALSVSNSNNTQNAVVVSTNANNASGIWSNCSGTGTGLSGSCTGTGGGIGVEGNDHSSSSGIGVLATSDNGTGLKATAANSGQWAGYFQNTGSSAGSSGALYATSAQGFAIYALGIVEFQGPLIVDGEASVEGTLNMNSNASCSSNMTVYGYLSKSGGGFMIDHPATPADKFLNHCFVESPEMLNVYRGRVVLDATGSATVALPTYFSAANASPEYILTPVGASMPNVHVSREVAGNTFQIAGGVPGKSVSWQVSAARADKWALANHPGVEINKTEAQKGKFMHPALFGEDASKQLKGAL